MSKIAILTLPLHANFGGNLQAYAMQKILRNLGHDAYLLNIQNYKKSNLYFILKQIIRKFLFFRNEYQLSYDENLIVNQNHRNFIYKYIPLTKEIYDLKQLNFIFENEGFEAVIVGSDQVWRSIYTPSIETYFLDFLEKNNEIKKIAYAASFGIDTWDYSQPITDKLSLLAKKFNYLGVREDSAVVLCKENLGVNAKHVLDPTLLLSQNDYLDLINLELTKNGTEIFSYILDSSKFKSEIIKLVSLQLNKKDFSIQIKKINKTSIKLSNAEDYIVPTIESWLVSFRDTRFIITDSFHGMVFSILFNKNFIVISNKERGATRFSSLLKLLNLENRLIDEKTDLNVVRLLIKDPIDYVSVNAKLGSMRSKILDDLKAVLS